MQKNKTWLSADNFKQLQCEVIHVANTVRCNKKIHIKCSK